MTRWNFHRWGCGANKFLLFIFRNGQDGVSLYCPPKPSAQFVLQPSSSSAFCSLNKLSSSAVKSSSSSHLFHGSGSDLGSNELSDRSSSVPPQWPVPSLQIPATPSGKAIWKFFLSGNSSVWRRPEKSLFLSLSLPAQLFVSIVGIPLHHLNWCWKSSWFSSPPFVEDEFSFFRCLLTPRVVLT